MKTLKGWYCSNLGFNKYVNVGDEIGECIINEFIKRWRPICMASNYFQAGFVCGFIKEANTNCSRPVYETFLKEDGKWIYKGQCFKGETIHRKYNFKS